MAHPPLRNVDAYPVEADGKTMFVIRDTEGVMEGAIMLSPAAFFVAAMLDGNRGTEEVQAEFARQFNGAVVHAEEVEQVVDQLDQRLLLRSEAYEQARKRLQEDFLDAPVRKAFSAGHSYAGEPGELDEQLREYCNASEGAGEPAQRGGSGVTGIIAPHIDFHRGGTCYSHAYRRIAEASDADTYIVLGVSHAGPPNPLIFTRKGFETPYGTVETDGEFVEAVAKRAGERIFEYEIAHRTEHSIEFQTVWLRHALGERPFRIVPILCSSFEAFCGEESPSKAAEIEEVIAALRDEIKSSGKKLCVVGGVDFAHVGPRFGDAVQVTPQLIKWMEAEDQKTLARIEEGDAEGFWESVMGDKNRRHVCGLGAVYTQLRLQDGDKGRLLRYAYAPDPAGGIVSFAAVEFTSES